MRPTKYNQDVLDKAYDYLVSYKELGDKIPSIAGLCEHIGRSRSIVYDWAKDPDKAEFSDILDICMQKQERDLLNGGLGGDFNSVVAKMILTKHGYSDKSEVDHSSKDGSMATKRETLDDFYGD